MVLWLVQIMALALAIPPMDDGVRRADLDAEGSSQGVRRSSSTRSPQASVEAEVAVGSLELFDQPGDESFVTGKLRRGDRVRVRADQASELGWLAIEPPPTFHCWIEESSLESTPTANGPQSDRSDFAVAPGATQAWVRRKDALIRSGHVNARLPGPPKGVLEAGTLVELVDRPPLILGSGEKASRWLAIVPPNGFSWYLRADGLRWVSPPEPAQPAAEILTSYEEPQSPGNAPPRAADRPSLPPGIAAELDRIDNVLRIILVSQPIENWRFDTVRADYQQLLRRAAGQTEVEEIVRARLAEITRREQAAKAAVTIESILAESHRRDAEVAKVRDQLASLNRDRGRAYTAIGFIQPSAKMVEGRKVFALIGSEGTAIAYLDIPPGLNPEPFLAQRVGVRGQARFNEEFGTRLITVRDMESLEARR